MRRIVNSLPWVLPPLVLLAVGIAAYSTRDRWQTWLPNGITASDAVLEQSDDHEGHDHGSGDEALVLSDRARKNLGLEIGTVAIGEYWQKLPIPGEVVDIAGLCDISLTSRVDGVVEDVYAFPGQAVLPGEPLFKMQITGEAVIDAQLALVNAVQQTKVNQAEIDRIKPFVPNTVPEATLLKLQYEQQTLAVKRDLHRQELRAHGLTDEEIDRVASGGAILKELIVRVPKSRAGHIHSLASDSPALPEEPPSHTFTVGSIDAHRGRLVKSGDLLARLTDHDRLLVCGFAFEKESAAVERALAEGWSVTAEFVIGEGQPLTRNDLKIQYTENVVKSGSRTLEFFLPIENEVIARRDGSDGGRYLSWRFKPGQQVRLYVPTQKWQDVIVLPAEAVTEEGAEAFAFAMNGKKLERRAVHVRHRDGRNVVIADDGALFPGERVALNNAYQLNLALKKQQGGGTDPHAGHMH